MDLDEKNQLDCDRCGIQCRSKKSEFNCGWTRGLSGLGSTVGPSSFTSNSTKLRIGFIFSVNFSDKSFCFIFVCLTNSCWGSVWGHPGENELLHTPSRWHSHSARASACCSERRPGSERGNNMQILNARPRVRLNNSLQSRLPTANGAWFATWPDNWPSITKENLLIPSDWNRAR